MQRKKLSEHAEDYLWELNKKVDKGTWRNHASTVRRFAEWYNSTHRSPASLDVAAVNAWLYGDRATRWDGVASTLAAGSFNNTLNFVKCFALWLEERDVIRSAARIADMRRKKLNETEKHRIDRTQMRQMLANASDPWERWLLVVGLETAGRVSELRRLQWKHLRTSSRVVKWYRQKTKKFDELTAMPLLLRESVVWRTYLTEQGYTVTEDSYLIPARRRADGNDFVYYPTRQPTAAAMSRAVKRNLLQFFSREELKGEAAHVLRRSAARELYEVWKEMGVADPMRKVQTLLGHSSITQTEVYIGVRRDREERNELMDGLDWLAVSDGDVVDLEAYRGQGRSV